MVGDPNNQDLDMIFSYFNEIGVISQLSGNAFERSMPGNMTLSQFTVLNWFTRVDDHATPGRLSTALMVTKGAMTNTLNKLKSKGLVTVTQDRHNARQKNVLITVKGKRIHAECLNSAQALMSEVAVALDFDRIRDQLPDLQALRQYLDARRSR